jgi:hypothetical protein
MELDILGAKIARNRERDRSVTVLFESVDGTSFECGKARCGGTRSAPPARSLTRKIATVPRPSLQYRACDRFYRIVFVGRRIPDERRLTLGACGPIVAASQQPRV